MCKCVFLLIFLSIVQEFMLLPFNARFQFFIVTGTSIESKYGAFYLKNEVSANGLVLVVQLS